MEQLQRRLGLTGSIAIGVAAMLGAGVFFVWSPAWNIAGPWMVVSLGIAAVVATLNGLVTTQLAVNHPVSGGIYSYGRHYRGSLVGFLAGWFFLTGKTASAAAIALVAATYLWPDNARLLAVGFITVFALIVISGIRTTAWVSLVIAAIVSAGLIALAAPAAVRAEWSGEFSSEPSWSIVTAAGLMFFAFAGYARMATLGEEVIDPRKTLPRAILGALSIVLVLYALVGLALIPRLEGSLAPDAPLALLAPDGLGWVVGVLAVIASLGSLLAILAGLSRTSLQMARHRDLPGVLSRLWSRSGGPVRSEIAVAVAAIVLVLLTDPLWLVGLSGAGVLSYYAIGHYSSLAQTASERLFPRWIPVVGLVLCGLLVVSLPPSSLLAWLVWSTVGLGWFAIATARRRRVDDSSA